MFRARGPQDAQSGRTVRTHVQDSHVQRTVLATLRTMQGTKRCSAPNYNAARRCSCCFKRKGDIVTIDSHVTSNATSWNLLKLLGHVVDRRPRNDQFHLPIRMNDPAHISIDSTYQSG